MSATSNMAGLGRGPAGGRASALQRSAAKAREKKLAIMTTEIRVAAPVQAAPGRLPLEALGDRDCRWPSGDPQTADFGFCGAPARPGSAYCPRHHARAYEPAPEPVRRPVKQGRRSRADTHFNPTFG